MIIRRLRLNNEHSCKWVPSVLEKTSPWLVNELYLQLSQDATDSAARCMKMRQVDTKSEQKSGEGSSKMAVQRSLAKCEACQGQAAPRNPTRPDLPPFSKVQAALASQIEVLSAILSSKTMPCSFHSAK